ncbi:unnamed protein product [Allacma fusca]|uniref:Uncharacterized protein n=1 Tax=Allacma fusca TaxID=39272 RepID=A0A8J2NXS7_9HEXA|nr:unnamed protein product [Allacma fusca]
MSGTEIEKGIFIASPPEKFVSKKAPQYIAALTATIGAFGLGTVIGWSAPSIPNIESRGDLDNLKANSELASWVASIMMVHSRELHSLGHFEPHLCIHPHNFCRGHEFHA